MKLVVVIPKTGSRTVFLRISASGHGGFWAPTGGLKIEAALKFHMKPYVLPGEADLCWKEQSLLGLNALLWKICSQAFPRSQVDAGV